MDTIFSYIEDAYHLSLAELKANAGSDWDDVQHDTALIEALAHAVATRRMREQGQIPPDYTEATNCKGCGPVFIFEGVPPEIEGCPWCSNRLSGRPVPHPTDIRCISRMQSPQNTSLLSQKKYA